MEFRFIDPATDFCNGLQVIQVYHDDLLKRGQALLALADEVRRQGMNEDRANQCIDHHCYYTRASLLHHRDEETGLFPLVVDQSALIDGMLERLAKDHQEIEEAWEALASWLSQPEKINNYNKFAIAAQSFEKLLREHLIRENEDFLPKLETLLTQEQCAQAGETMRRLRFGSIQS